MKTVSRAEVTDLQQIPNIGPSIAANLRLIDVLSGLRSAISGSLARVSRRKAAAMHNWSAYGGDEALRTAPSAA